MIVLHRMFKHSKLVDWLGWTAKIRNSNHSCNLGSPEGASRDQLRFDHWIFSMRAGASADRDASVEHQAFGSMDHEQMTCRYAKNIPEVEYCWYNYLNHQVGSNVVPLYHSVYTEDVDTTTWGDQNLWLFTSVMFIHPFRWNKNKQVTSEIRVW